VVSTLVCCAEIYAQWGDTPKALEWLEKALQLRDPGLVDLKADPLMDPLRKEPRFVAGEVALKFSIQLMNSGVRSFRRRRLADAGLIS